MKKLLRFLTKLFWLFFILGLILTVLVISWLASLEADLPNVNVLKTVNLQAPLRVFTQDGKLIAEFGSIRRIPITLDQVPKPLIDATLATEDHRFFEHGGVDFRGLARAAVILFTTGKKAQGGSTITMQVARNFFLTRKKNYIRKIREILLALKIDHNLTKQKILELYFNKIFYGNRAYGVNAAAKIYYGKPLDQLTLAQMAMLAGLPKAPSTLNPLRNKEAALKRREHVLNRMLELHYIDENQYEMAVNEPMTASYHGLKVSVKAPYVAEMVRSNMIQIYGQEKAYNHGFDVYTTIDSNLQEFSNSAVKQTLFAYDKRHGFRGPIKNLSKLPMNLWPLELNKELSFDGLEPAAITAIFNTSCSAILKDGQIITIPFNSMTWARRQIVKNNRAYLTKPPISPADILRIGDVVYVTQQTDDSWALSQLPEVEGALVALNPKNGEIQALTGGFNYYKSKFNRVLQADRQPGSSFKPFVYSAALHKGFTLATVINDAPVVIQDAGLNVFWRPENDTRLFYGPTRLRVALMQSRNLVSIRLLQLIGIPYAIDYATRFGFRKDQLPKSLSLALGTALVTPIEMGRAFSVFANGGYLVAPFYIDRILDADDKIVYKANPKLAGLSNEEAPPSGQDDHNNSADNKAPRVISPQNAYLIDSALKDVIKRGTGRNALVLKRNDLAGKTGTTNDQTNGWFCGFNGNLVAIAWIGYDEPKSLYEYAAKAALPMWIDFMQNALGGQPESFIQKPSGIVNVRIDAKTGKLAGPNDKHAIFELFREKDAPQDNETAQATISNQGADEPNALNQIY